jgi:hypothetical protein
MPIARQRLGKHIPEVALSTIGHILLDNGLINTNSLQQKTVFSVRSVPRNYKRAQSGELKQYEGVRRSTVGSQKSVQSEEDDNVSDSDLSTVVTNCIKVP